MTARHPLHEFMPYGAPELIAAQRPNLLRALAVASTLALAMFLLARTLPLSLPSEPVIELPKGPKTSVRVEPPPSIAPIAPTAPPAVAPSPPRGPAYPVPVSDDVVPSVVPERDLMGAQRDDGFAGVLNPSGIGEAPIADGDEAPPDRKQWVYTDELPVAVKIVKPDYPDMPRQLGIEGPVYVHMLVGKDGRVMRVELDETLHVPMLDETALAAARQWVFKPALAEGHPVMVWVAEKFVFRLH
jgi:protein TonB